MDNTLEVVLKEKDIAKENAAQLIEAFGAPFTEAGKIIDGYQKIVVTSEDQTDLMGQAREQRLALKKVRTGVETKRKELKENALRTGQTIDFVAKYIKDSIEPAERHLELQEKFAEIKQAERKAKVKLARIDWLMQYTDNLAPYDLDNIGDEAFNELIAELKSAHEARVAEEKRIEAARVAQEEATRKEQERVRAENEELKKEAEQREIQAKIEQAEREKEQKKLEAEAERKLSAERAKVEAERLEREKLEQEKRQREEAEAKAKRETEEAERQALLAPDKDKILSFSAALEMIRTQKLPAVKTKQAQDVVNEIDVMLTKMQAIIKTKAKSL